MKDLKNKVAVVTGGASGIGFAICRRFGEEGMKVVIADVSQEALNDAQQTLRDEGIDAIAVQCDVRDLASVEALRDAAVNQYGAVHVLCNNAGVGSGGGGKMWEVDMKDWRWAYEVNVLGVVHGIRAFVPLMLEQDCEAHIVNTSSGNGGVSPLPSTPIYAATKAGVTNLSECLYAQLEAVTDKISVSVLYPGPNWMNTGIFNSDRIRPEEFHKPDAPPRMEVNFDILRETLIASGEDFVETPLSDVANTVFEGIVNNQFWMLPTSTRTDDSINKRAEAMLKRAQPDYMIIDRPPAAGGLWFRNASNK